VWNGYRIPLPKDTSLDANWSGWVTAIPPGDQVESVSGSFRIPPGLKPSTHHRSALAFWVGTGGAHRPAFLLQSYLELAVDGQYGGLFPANGVLNDCSSNAACLAALTTPPFVQVTPGSLFTVHLTFVPLAGQRSWLGFWMNTRLVVKTRGRVVDRAVGRLYLPPWAADQNSVEAVVESMGDRHTGIVTALPNGHWHATVVWHVQLSRPWPSRTWPATHLFHTVASGWYPRRNYVTHLHTLSLQVLPSGETGRGVVSYNDEVKP
jgi:hypothetical protein